MHGPADDPRQPFHVPATDRTNAAIAPIDAPNLLAGEAQHAQSHDARLAAKGATAPGHGTLADAAETFCAFGEVGGGEVAVGAHIGVIDDLPMKKPAPRDDRGGCVILAGDACSDSSPSPNLSLQGRGAEDRPAGAPDATALRFRRKTPVVGRGRIARCCAPGGSARNPCRGPAIRPGRGWRWLRSGRAG